jgi:hypothetical protein
MVEPKNNRKRPRGTAELPEPDGTRKILAFLDIPRWFLYC